MKEKVVLISPNTLGSYRSAIINDENLALGYLATVLEKDNYQIEIIDARMNKYLPEIVAEKIKTIQPFFLGISTISEESMPWIEALEKLLDKPAYLRHVCMGGYYPSLQPKAVLQRLSFVNSVAIGEGELTVVELANKVLSGEPWNNVANLALRSPEGTIVVNERRAVISNLDSLPLPKRYASQDSSEIVIEGSRGCFGNCTFCAVGPHFGAERKLAWRGRSPEHIVAEILRLRKVYPDNIRYRFIDPDFFGSASQVHSQRVLEIASLIKKHVPGIELYIEARVIDIRRMDVLTALKEAGLKEIYLGIESGSERILSKMGKRSSVSDTISATRILDELEINYQYGYMMITPWTEYQDVIDSLALLRTIGRVQFDKLFNELYLIPGTVLVEEVGCVCKLRKEGDTGYYSYESNRLVENIRALGLVFETRHKVFAEGLWHLYKDVQRHEQCHVHGAVDLQRKLSNLFIAIFEFCLERCSGELLTDTDICQLAETTIDHFQGEAQVIRASLDPSITFTEKK